MEVSHYYGRQVLAYPCEMDNLPSEIQIIDPIEIRSTTIRCRRCNQIIKKPDAALPHHQYYLNFTIFPNQINLKFPRPF